MYWRTAFVGAIRANGRDAPPGRESQSRFWLLLDKGAKVLKLCASVGNSVFSVEHNEKLRALRRRARGALQRLRQWRARPGLHED